MSGKDIDIFPYCGTVIHGLHHGEDFGFPSANIQLAGDEVIATGVYAVQVNIAGIVHNGMLYVGTRPTLGLSQRTIEIHIFNFDRDIYGETVAFKIIHKVREEHKFSSVAELIKQLKHDKEQIKKML